jgi:hypothetical protein
MSHVTSAASATAKPLMNKSNPMFPPRLLTSSQF